jgi:hypothetical protein
VNVPRIDSNSVVSWSSKAVAAEVNDEIVLMNLERDRCYGLGLIGSGVWRRLATPIRVSDVVSQLSEEYDAPRGTIETDLLRTLQKMYSEGLLQVTGSDESLA